MVAQLNDDDVHWDDDAKKEVKDMKTSIINPEVHLTPSKQKKGVLEANQPEAVVNKTPTIEPQVD